MVNRAPCSGSNFLLVKNGNFGAVDFVAVNGKSDILSV